MTTIADIIRQYAGACAAQAGQLSRQSTVKNLQCITDAVECYGNAEILYYDVLYLRNRMHLCMRGKQHWQCDCEETCR